MTETITMRENLVEILGFTPARLDLYSDVAVTYLIERVEARDQFSFDWFDCHNKYINKKLTRYDYHSNAVHSGKVIAVRPPTKSERQQGVRVFHLLIEWDDHLYGRNWIPTDAPSIKFKEKSLNG